MQVIHLKNIQRLPLKLINIKDSKNVHRKKNPTLITQKQHLLNINYQNKLLLLFF